MQVEVFWSSWCSSVYFGVVAVVFVVIQDFILTDNNQKYVNCNLSTTPSRATTPTTPTVHTTPTTLTTPTN